MKKLLTTLCIVVSVCACGPRAVVDEAPAVDVAQITLQIESNNAAIERSQKILAQLDKVAAAEKRVADTQEKLRELGHYQGPSAFDQEQMKREIEQREELLVKLEQLTRSNKVLSLQISGLRKN